MARRTYHHGDLKRALLDAAIVFLRKHDLTALNLQVVAKAAGVSPGAPYHHFDDKVGLLGALATEGFEMLFAAIDAAVKAVDAPREKLAALADAYLGFAERHPQHYSVMYLREVGDLKRFVALHAASGRSFALLVEIVTACHRKLSRVEAESRAVAAWSTCHGFASLHGTGVLTNMPGAPSLKAMRAMAIEQVIA